MKNLLIALLLLATFTLNAQVEVLKFTEPERKDPLFKLNDISLTYGYFYGYYFSNGRNDIEHLLGSTNTVLQDSATSFYNGYSEGNHTVLAANFSIRAKSVFLYQTVGVGLGYSDFYGFSYNRSSFDRTVIDTLTSNSNPYYVIVDSIAEQSKSGNLRTNNLFLNLSYRISTNPARKVSVYAMVNLGVGGAVKSTYNNYDFYFYGKQTSPLLDSTGALNNQTNSNHYFSHSGYSYYNPDNNGAKAAKPFMLRPYLTAGINYRLSKKIKVLRNLSLNVEGRYGAQMYFIKGRTYSGFSRGLAIGLRYTITALYNPRYMKDIAMAY